MIHYVYIGHFVPEGRFIRFARSGTDTALRPVLTRPLDLKVFDELLRDRGLDVHKHRKECVGLLEPMAVRADFTVKLRLFLEEAAGVSKYKERRRETANRLSDTRENLTRVEDILRELNANLDRLEKQAEVAMRYNTLQADGTLKQHQLWFLKRSESEAEAEGQCGGGSA